MVTLQMDDDAGETGRSGDDSRPRDRGSLSTNLQLLNKNRKLQQPLPFLTRQTGLVLIRMRIVNWRRLMPVLI